MTGKHPLCGGTELATANLKLTAFRAEVDLDDGRGGLR
jgi:hypothetical protein